MSSLKIMPLSMLDKCINHSVWVIMKGKREFAGTLLGFDDFFNMVLGGVTEVWIEGEERKSRTSESILLNGHDIAFVNSVVARWCQETILLSEGRSQPKRREKRSK
jgi:U6 snRNA-associated Sm-like protein LSm5